MPICGTQLAEWFRERGILTAAKFVPCRQPLPAAFHQAIDKTELLQAIARPIIAQRDRAGNPTDATAQPDVQEMAS
jgi:hypothetical protein